MHCELTSGRLELVIRLTDCFPIPACPSQSLGVSLERTVHSTHRSSMDPGGGMHNAPRRPSLTGAGEQPLPRMDGGYSDSDGGSTASVPVGRRRVSTSERPGSLRGMPSLDASVTMLSTLCSLISSYFIVT